MKAKRRATLKELFFVSYSVFLTGDILLHGGCTAWMHIVYALLLSSTGTAVTWFVKYRKKEVSEQ